MAKYLVACTPLYNPLCLLVCRMVGWSVTLSYFGVYRWFLGSGPEEVDDLCFPPPGLETQIPASMPIFKPKFKPQGPNPSVKAQTPASRPKPLADHVHSLDDLFITAPAHLHATLAAVYPALLKCDQFEVESLVRLKNPSSPSCKSNVVQKRDRNPS